MALFVGWSGWEAKQAFAHGALNLPVWCLDRALIREERQGAVSERTVARGLTIQVAQYEDELGRGPALRWATRATGWYWAIRTFWGADERRHMFDGLRGRMTPCAGLRGSGRR